MYVEFQLSTHTHSHVLLCSDNAYFQAIVLSGFASSAVQYTTIIPSDENHYFFHYIRQQRVSHITFCGTYWTTKSSLDQHQQQLRRTPAAMKMFILCFFLSVGLTITSGLPALDLGEVIDSEVDDDTFSDSHEVDKRDVSSCM